MGGGPIRTISSSVKHGLVGEVELLVGGEAGAGEVAGADDSGEGLEAISAAHRQVAVEDVALGVEKAVLERANAHHVAAQESDEVLHPPEGRFVKGGDV